MSPRLDSLGRPTRWPSAAERFSSRYTEAAAPEGFDSPCWQWDTVGSEGYGAIRDGSIRLAHRWSYEHHIGPIPDELVLDHLCRNRACVNPAHLEPVTNAENIRRGVGAQRAAEQRIAKTHCKRGHEFTAENTYLYQGRRYCRACGRARSASGTARAAS